MVKAEEVDFGIGSLNVAAPEVRFSLLLTNRMGGAPRMFTLHCSDEES
jgi:hypothetical protein